MNFKENCKKSYIKLKKELLLLEKQFKIEKNLLLKKEISNKISNKQILLSGLNQFLKDDLCV